ncbi:MAG: M48 family metalloprotease [Chitinophagales bacterium]
MKKYKRYSLGVIFAITSFFLFYIMMTGLTAVLFAYSLLLFIDVIASYDLSIILAVLSFTFVVFTFSLFFFFIKFLFVKKIEEKNCNISLDKEKEPKLYNQIMEVCNKVDTHPPHEIFLSPDVNASVMLPTGFWSLFSKPKKSLVIGLGLVNVVNVSEFRAVLAHEFGHFSQKSVGLSPYLAHINQIIYNTVFQKDKFDDFLIKWANVGFLSIFASLLIFLVNIIRVILEKAYQFINLSFMKLSRANEFHADYIAAKMEGKENIIQGLRKIEFANAAYESSTHILDEYTPQKKITKNVYDLHTACMKIFAEINEISFEENMPYIIKQKLNDIYKYSRVEIKDAWASHPTLIEREENLEKTNFSIPIKNGRSAWSLFSDKIALQNKITEEVYRLGIDYPYEEAQVNESFFLEKVADLKGYHPRFKGFYNNRKISQVDIEKLKKSSSSDESFIPSFYTEKNTERLSRFLQNETDCQVLEAINNGSAQVKHFFFDGKKSVKKDAWSYMQTLNKEIEEDKKWLNELDDEIIEYNYHYLKNNNKEEVLSDYLQHIVSLNTMQQYVDRGQTILLGVHNIIMFMSSKHFFNEQEVKDVNSQGSSLFGEFRQWIEESKDIPLSESVVDELEIKGSLYSYILETDLIVLKHTMFEDGTYGEHYMQFNRITNKSLKVLHVQTKELLAYFQS